MEFRFTVENDTRNLAIKISDVSVEIAWAVSSGAALALLSKMADVFAHVHLVSCMRSRGLNTAHHMTSHSGSNSRRQL